MDTNAIVQGSSPRVWGQAQGAAVFFRDDGIIPTRMGTSAKFSDGTNPFEDHPHAYGDKSLRISRAQYFPGSSPRVWGQVNYF